MYAGHPNNELEKKVFRLEEYFFIIILTKRQLKIRVRTIVMGSDNIKDNLRSFKNRYNFLFSMDIAGHYSGIFSGNLGKSRHLRGYRELESIYIRQGTNRGKQS